MARTQATILQVTWRGAPVASVYAAEDNLGVAGVRIGPFYADWEPTHKQIFMSSPWGKAWVFLLSGLRVETAQHIVKIFPLKCVFRVR